MANYDSSHHLMENRHLGRQYSENRGALISTLAKMKKRRRKRRKMRYFQPSKIKVPSFLFRPKIISRKLLPFTRAELGKRQLPAPLLFLISFDCHV